MIYRKIVRHQGILKEYFRLMKIGEEFGEAIQAYISYYGANKRKFNASGGVFATAEDISNELVDVIITAFVAMHDYTADPVTFFEARLQVIADRVNKEGS